ncbi:MAG: YebC/PmpR family DNA-binding transcriptional regulator [Dehalococcoidia bacterium]|nr:YebC/PmpR family DNA-binding transcriptional regulator [Dehalococcoidia bacterium]
MSGHSKWSSIKHAKGVTDARRGQLFTKLTREIMVAAREGELDPETNFHLRLAVQKAKDNSMPSDNIDRAIKKASGVGEGSALMEITYEGYGPGGVAILVQALTDNKNRTVQEMRTIFSRGGGNLGEAGCVAWIFKSKGVITLEPDNEDPEELGLFAIDSGAEDVRIEKEYLEVITDAKNLEAVRNALEEKGSKISSAEISMEPQTMVKLDEKSALTTLRLLDKLEEMDDVQKVYSNVDYSDEVLEALKAPEA